MFKWENIVRSSPFDTSRFDDGTNFSLTSLSALPHLTSKKSPTPSLFNPLCSSPKSTRKMGPGMLGRKLFRNRDLLEPDGPQRQTGLSSAKMSLRLAGRTSFSFLKLSQG